jgi:hypothetical protein
MLSHGSFPLSAQALAPVIDPAHILETIHNGYLMYQSVLNSIQQLEYAYETTQAQLKEIQQLDYTKIKSFTDAVSFVDEQLSFVRQTEQRFKSVGITVGGTTIPLTQFYRVPGEAVDMVVNDMTRNMSDYEKAQAWSNYGLDPANYMYIKSWEGRLQDAGKQLAVIGDVIEANNEKKAKEVQAIIDEAEKSEGSLAVLQSLTALMQIMIGEQMEANRLNGMTMQNQENKDKAGDLPVKPQARFSADWLE